MKECYAVLLDTTSIQQYVYSSNKLKSNTGASFIIEYLLKKMAEECIEDITKYCNVEEGYTGGGNSLIFFEKIECANEFVKKITLKALSSTPGLKIATGTEKFSLTESGEEKNKVFGKYYFSNYNEDRDELFKILNINKRKYFPKITLDSFGINEDCPMTGKSAEVWDETIDQYVSSIYKTKTDYSEQALNIMNSRYKTILNGREFPKEFGELGGTKSEDSHVAIVHIDGNSTGNKFKECSTLGDTKELSEKLINATKRAFEKLLENINENIHEIDKILTLGSKYVPLRPIVIGGDDITFVCDGRLGIYFAEKFIEYFEEQTKESLKMTACAGVAIVKEKYPFYRGYMLAEDLCRNAKQKRYEKDCSNSWIDYHFVEGSFTGNIDDIRKNHFTGIQGNLFMKPYPLSGNKRICFYEIKQAAKILSEKDKNGKTVFPKNKLNEIREILTLGDSACKEYRQNLKVRCHELPDVAGKFKNEFFLNRETPYIDVIELINNYPFELSDAKGAKK